ncbi:MAG TPA: DNA polymerase III subunit delta [Patescibacteria group bacterium]|nr:DNA polymerase III subunit delta [Patescibacteria group bacterium]
MVIFLYGKDTYNSRQRLNFLKNRFIKKFGQNKNLSISNLDANKIDPREINKYLFSRGLFTNKKLIIINHPFSPYNKNKVKLEALAQNLIKPVKNIAKKSPQDSNILIFWDQDIIQKDLDKNQKKLFNFLKNLNHTKKFKPFSSNETKTWIQKRVYSLNKEITPKAVFLLEQIYQNNLYALKNEIEKIVHSNLTENKITEEKIKELILKNPQQSIWDLIDAVGQKNKPKALTLLKQTLDQGTSIDYIIAMLGYQYRLLLKVKSFQDNNNNENMAKALSIHPYPLKKALKASKDYNLSEIKKIYIQLTNIDLIRKKTVANPEILLDLLIIKS